MSDNIIQVNDELIHTELKDLIRNSVEEALNDVTAGELFEGTLDPAPVAVINGVV